MRSLIVLLLTFVISFSSAAQQADTAGKPKTGTVSGNVINGTANEPLRKTSVVLVPARDAESANDDAKSKRVMTDENGAFRFSDVTPGKYFVVAERAGYTPRRLASQRKNVVTVAAGEEARTSVKLVPAATIVGQIIDEDGDPLPNAVVQVLKPIYVFGRRDYAPMQFGKTNDRGEFRVSPVPPGTYFLAAMKSKMMEGFFNAVASGSFGMSRDDMEEGAVRYPPRFFPNAETLADAQPLQLKAGEEFPVNFTMPASRTYRVRGKVTGIPMVAPGAKPENYIFAHLSLVTNGQSLSLTALGNQTALNTKDNTFEFDSVLPGSYTLMLNGGGRKARYKGRAQVVVTAADVEAVNVTATEAGSGMKIAGKLRVAQEGMDPAALHVNLRAMGRDSFVDIVEGSSDAHVKKAGDFEIPVELGGTYMATISSHGTGPEDWYTESARYGGRDVTGASFEIGSAPATLEITVRKDGARIEGRVVDGDNKPVAGATVVAVPEPKFREWPEAYSQANTDQNGRFVIRGVRPGNYTVAASEDLGEEEYLDPAIVAVLEKDGTTVKAQAAGKYEVTLKPLAVE